MQLSAQVMRPLLLRVSLLSGQIILILLAEKIPLLAEKIPLLWSTVRHKRVLAKGFSFIMGNTKCLKDKSKVRGDF